MSFQSFLKDYHALFEQADTLVNSFSTWIVFCAIHEHYRCLSRRNNIRDQFRLQNNQNVVLQFFFKNFIVIIYVTILVIYFFMQQLSSFSLTKHFCEANLGLNKIFSTQFSVFVFVNLCKQTTKILMKTVTLYCLVQIYLVCQWLCKAINLIITDFSFVFDTETFLVSLLILQWY